MYPTFVGYNVKEHDNDTISCHVPLAIQLYELLDEMTSFWQPAVSNLALPCWWSRCQEQHVREGVAIVNRMVPTDLHNRLMTQIYRFSKQTIVDYHPHSNDMVRAILGMGQGKVNK